MNVIKEVEKLEKHTCPVPPSCESKACSQSGWSPLQNSLLNWVTIRNILAIICFNFYCGSDGAWDKGAVVLQPAGSNCCRVLQNTLNVVLCFVSQNIGITKEGSWRLGISWFGQWSSNSRSAVTWVMLVISTVCHLGDDGGDAADDKKHKEDYHLPFPQQTPQLSCLSLLLSGVKQ